MKNHQSFSNAILKINRLYGGQASELIKKLNPANKHVFIEVDCAPNGELNPFRLGNGLESAKIIKDLAGSFLGEDRSWFEEKLAAAKNADFQLSFDQGEKIGLWTRVRQNDYREKINFNEPFCIKNTKGITKIWHPDWRQFGHNQGFATRSNIVNFIFENEAYQQKFYMPLLAPAGGPAWKMYYRLVFLCEDGQAEPELVGGLWISRPGFKIYPGKGSLVGLISPQKTNDLLVIR